MDLETIIPLAIVAIAYLFKAFDGARKKDAKKTPPAPGRPSAPGRPVTARRTDTRPIPRADARPAPRTNTGQTTLPNARPPARTASSPPPRADARPAPAPPQIPEGQWWEESSPARETSAPRREFFPWDDPRQHQEEGWLQGREEAKPQGALREPGRELHESARALSPASVRASAAAARHQRNPALTELVREPEETNEYAEFDLRDAVIKSVILERREF